MGMGIMCVDFIAEVRDVTSPFLHEHLLSNLNLLVSDRFLQGELQWRGRFFCIRRSYRGAAIVSRRRRGRSFRGSPRGHPAWRGNRAGRGQSVGKAHDAPREATEGAAGEG